MLYASCQPRGSGTSGTTPSCGGGAIPQSGVTNSGAAAARHRGLNYELSMCAGFNRLAIATCAGENQFAARCVEQGCTKKLQFAWCIGVAVTASEP